MTRRISGAMLGLTGMTALVFAGVHALAARPAAAPPAAPVAVTAPPVTDRCTALAGQTLPGDVKILTARTVGVTPAGTRLEPDAAPLANSIPPHCRIEGVIGERTGAGGKPFGIGFALALPDDWNGRFLLQGGGGLNGTVHPPIGAAAAGDIPALARGFAVASHDSGHKGAVFDDSFMADQRAALDFSENAVPTVARTAKAIIASYYGRAIGHSYMAGCSTGGRESMLAAQRYPELFDGIVVGAPAMRTGNSNLALSWAAVQFNQAAPRDGAGKPLVERIFSDADRAVLKKGLLAQCDGLDGLDDGMIMNVGQCRFDASRLACRKGQKADCLKPAQVTAIQRAFTAPRDKAGASLYAPYPYDTGITNTEGGIPGFLPTGKPGVFGPANRDLAIDVDARIQSVRANASQRLIDTDTWTNLNTFLGRGGKILFYHGVSDPWFSAFDTLNYWQRASAANGAAWRGASRFYMVPGMGHCRGGDSFDDFDLLGAVVAWVEQGRTPEAVLSWRSSQPSRQRPMCPWPSYAHYTGGDAELAGSYECRMPYSAPKG